MVFPVQKSTMSIDSFQEIDDQKILKFYWLKAF